MKRLLFVAAICMVAAPALASPELLPVRGLHYATYHAATGELTPTPGPVRYGDPVWSATYEGPWYSSNWDDQEVFLDWGDCGDPADPYTINGFQFAYATGTCLPDVFDAIMWFYGEEDGFNSLRVPLAGFLIEVPGGNCPDWNGWIVTVDLEGTGFEFDLSGSDIEGDGLVDFGYTYWWRGLPAGDPTGPILAGDPNEVLWPPGMEDAFDSFEPPDDANMPDGSVGLYLGTWWWGGPPNPVAQFWMELYEGNAPNMPEGCPNPGGSGWYCTADIEYTNECVVDLLDLAALLRNYGLTTGATHEQGDVEPEDGNGVWEDGVDGDGDVDLADLAQLLRQYGDDCNE